VRQPSRKPTPKPSPTVVVANKQKAAIGQLESAILLWFNEADPISILVLATNAHDCYHALGKQIGKPSFHGEWIETMPHSFQKRAKYVQDFAKHGFKDLEENATFDAIFAEGLMVVSVDCHRDIFGKFTPLMALYAARMHTEHPNWTLPETLPQVVKDSGIIEEVGRGSRKQCFNSLYAAFASVYSALP